jgi:chaperonin GroEL
MALLGAIDAVATEEEKAQGDERTGLRMLRRALETPTRQLAENSGLDPGVVVERMRANGKAVGLDAARGTYVDLVQAGIVDPTKVIRIALENAVSVAGTLLLTEATLTEVPEEKPKGSQASPQDFD